MAEYFDREVCLSILRAKANMAVLMGAAPYFEKAAQMLEQLPAADVAPVVHGHKVDDGGFYARCSQCDGVLPLCANYCPNCGAKMDGGADNA